MSQPHMAMAGMGGPVGGGPAAQPMNAGTPTNSAAQTYTPDAMIKKLNTAIYEYLLVTEKYEVARMLKQSLPIETADHIKLSPGQRANQANGVDGMDIDDKEHVNVKNRPEDLPAPASLHNDESSFLQDWWFQFWEIHQANRHKGRQNTINYVGHQRQAQKLRQGMMNNMDPSMQMRNYTNMMNGGMDLRHAAMKNAKGGMNAQAMAQIRTLQSANQGNQMQGLSMERSGSQMDMNGPQSGSPHNGDAPSPKRQRIDGNMQPTNQGRPGQPGQMGGNQVGSPSNIPPSLDPVSGHFHDLLLANGLNPDLVHNMSPQQLHILSQQPPNARIKSLQVYSDAMHNQAQAAMQKATSNAEKGMPQSNAMVPNGAHSSPMSQQAMDSNEYYTPGNNRGNMPPNGALAQVNGQQNGNHALQDYQMQLMLLEQQNKKRLLMARQEQDNMGSTPGTNGGRGSPTPSLMDPNANPAIRAPMTMGVNGQPMMRPPSSNPMSQHLTPQQMDLMRQGGQLQNGWAGVPQMPGQMLPQGPNQQMAQPPNMTPRAGHMPPPPAPPGATGTQPSSPAQPAAPPTPSATNKPKPATKKETKASKAAAKKGAAAATSEETAPPTPTPPPPVTPSAASSFAQNKNLAMTNGQPGQAQQNHQNQQAGAVQPPQPDMGMAQFGSLDLEFAGLDSGDVLDNFDFDSFLNNDEHGIGGFPAFDANLAPAFDANLAFDGNSNMETDGIGN